jgi:hypothetical protein
MTGHRTRKISQSRFVVLIRTTVGAESTRSGRPLQASRRFCGYGCGGRLCGRGYVLNNGGLPDAAHRSIPAAGDTVAASARTGQTAAARAAGQSVRGCFLGRE